MAHEMTMFRCRYSIRTCFGAKRMFYLMMINAVIVFLVSEFLNLTSDHPDSVTSLPQEVVTLKLKRPAIKQDNNQQVHLSKQSPAPTHHKTTKSTMATKSPTKSPVATKSPAPTKSPLATKSPVAAKLLQATDLNKLLYGVELDQLNQRLYKKEKPFTFLPEYKNPCWIEHLPSNYMTEYNLSSYVEYGRRAIRQMAPIYDERLKQEAEPWRIRCLPYFYLMGVTKSGTTDFFGGLTGHPEVSGPWVKEPMYWNRKRYPKGCVVHKSNFSRHSRFFEYLNLFDHAAHHINQTTGTENPRHSHIIGDGSTYLFWEDNGWTSHPDNNGMKPKYTTAMALHAAQPQAKFILLLRNPITRIYSAYNMYDEKQRSPEKFDQLAKQSVEEYKKCFIKHGIIQCAYNSTLSRQSHPISLVGSMYSVFLADWYAVYPRNQILIIHSEQYYTDRIKYLFAAYKFLGLGPISNQTVKMLERRQTSREQKYDPMLNSTRTLLEDFFKPFNTELYGIIKRVLWDSTT